MSVARTTISIEREVFESGQQRAKALRYASFSEYVAYLIATDLKERGKHVTVREEPGTYGRPGSTTPATSKKKTQKRSSG
jgi:hypothetical protein